jgi:hypothetical protein
MGHERVIGWTIFIVLCFAVLFLMFSEPPQQEVTAVEKPQEQKAQIVGTYIDGAAIYTVLHDDHKLIVATRYGGGTALLHHPDCPCGKAER